MSALIIAIDGPSGAGKGTVARAVSKRLGCDHVDSGAMYRAVGWKALLDGVALDDEPRVEAIATGADLSIGDAGVRIDGHDVTRAIRTPEIDKAAAAVARLPRVREVIVARLRAMAAAGSIVMEGRDIGTVVFPDAHLKLYLDASADERARRRSVDPAHSGVPKTVAEVASQLTARDHSDRTRAASPLQTAPDAIYIDTTGLSIDDVVLRVMAQVERVQAGQ